MRCSNCGSEVAQSEKICGNCGENNAYYVQPYQPPPQQPYQPQGQPYGQQYAQPQTQTKESKAYAILALIFGALGGWLGLLFGIIGLVKYKGDIHSSERVMCWIGIGLWIFWFVANIVLLALL